MKMGCSSSQDKTSSRQLPLLMGLLALAASTLTLCFARTYAGFVLGRLFQGVSSAVVWCVGMALIVDTVGREGVGEAMEIVRLAFSKRIWDLR